jgi:hypothetical protein
VTADALRRWRDEVGDVTVLGRVRLVLGLLLLVDALRATRELQRGYFGDVFHWPLVPEALVPSRKAYTVLVALQVVLAVLVVVGRRARPALALAALVGTFVLACDRLQFHNNRYALFCYALLLSLTPCDRSVHLGPPTPRTGPLWGARLAGTQLALVYIASGGSKLLDADWRSGQVLLERLHLYGAQALAAGVPTPLMEWLSQPGTTSALAKLAIATELLLAVGLWSKRTRVLALWWGVWFHLVIEATSRVEGFTWLTLAMYGVFVTPDVRARRVLFDGTRPWARGLARVVAFFDWLARFEVRAGARDERGGHALMVVRRDGWHATGVDALAMVARCTPLFFPIWVPLAVVAGLVGRGRARPPA